MRIRINFKEFTEIIVCGWTPPDHSYQKHLEGNPHQTKGQDSDQEMICDYTRQGRTENHLLNRTFQMLAI